VTTDFWGGLLAGLLGGILPAILVAGLCEWLAPSYTDILAPATYVVAAAAVLWEEWGRRRFRSKDE
jgi:hypothetical protein